MMQTQKISVFGLGPVGLVTAVCFAKRGYEVVGVDPDSRRVELIQNAQAPFFEPSLDAYLTETIKNGKLKATSDSAANANSDFAYITVGTPSLADGNIDLTYIRSAAVAIGRSLRSKKEYQLVLVKSTVIPGTARDVVKPIIEEESGKLLGRSFGLCSNPEFLREGNAIYDSDFPDRIVIGGQQDDLNRLEAFYREFYGDKTPPIIRTSFENAELTKYANNSFLALKVSFINMIANLCQKTTGADVEDVAKGIGLDKRIGALFLRSGLGWGGSCFPKDLKAMAAYGKKINVKTTLVDAAIDVNDNQPLKAIELARRLLGGNLRDKKIAVLGLAFKPDTDDIRGAVSIPMIKEILAAKAEVVAYDPAAMPNTKKILQNEIKYATNPVNCIDQADCCIIVTEWEEFKKILPAVFVEKMRRPIVVDGRRIYDPSAFRYAGVTFSAIGLGDG
jgi:UDPglucose 6-dehydrogenase